MSFIEHVKSLLRKQYPNQPQSYRTCVSAVRQFIKHADIQSKEQFLQRADYYLGKIDSYKRSKETKRLVLFVLALVLKNLGQKKFHREYYNAYRKLKKEIEETRKKNEARGEKEQQCLSWTLEKLRSKSINENDLTQKALLYNLLVFLDETPRLEFRFLIFQPAVPSTEDNYLFRDDEKGWYIMLNQYKTMKRYGPWKISLQQNQDLANYVSKYVQANQLQPGQHIFLNARQQPFPSNKFSEFVQRTFFAYTGTRITINCLRKIKENHLFLKNPKSLEMSLAQKEDWVQNHFRHSLNTSQLYYNRIDPNRKPRSVTIIREPRNFVPQKDLRKSSPRAKNFAPPTKKKTPKDFEQELNRLMKEFNLSNLQVSKIVSGGPLFI